MPSGILQSPGCGDMSYGCHIWTVIRTQTLTNAHIDHLSQDKIFRPSSSVDAEAAGEILPLRNLEIDWDPTKTSPATIDPKRHFDDSEI